MILNLIDESLGKIPYKITKYPDGHKHFLFTGSAYDMCSIAAIVIVTRLKDGDDIFILKQAVKVLRTINPNVQLHLKVHYLLAARYDRHMQDYFDSCDLEIVGDEINSLNFCTVGIVEPHSDKALAYIKRSHAKPVLDERVKSLIQDYKNFKSVSYDVCFVVPDLGAVKRVETLLKGHSHVNVVYSNKRRNLSTGDILGIDIFNPNDLKPNVIIFDDLCDGGRTFTELAKRLRSAAFCTVKNITLAVTHGIFSKGLEVLLTSNQEGSYVDKIITTDSYSDQKHFGNHFGDKFEVINI